MGNKVKWPLIYGRLHRDMLKIAIDENYSKEAMRLYEYFLLNSKPRTGLLRDDPALEDVGKALHISRRGMYYFRDQFKADHVYIVSPDARGLKGTVMHAAQIEKDLEIHKEYGTDPALLVGGDHPIANNIFGRIPRRFLEVAIGTHKNYKKTHHRLYWWISLNCADAGHLTRFTELPDLAKELGCSVARLTRTYADLHKDALFTIKSPSHIQGTAQPIADAVTEAAAKKAKKEQQKAYRKALRAYIKAERLRVESYGARPGEKRKLRDEEIKRLTREFREHYEKTGEFLAVRV